ncbi:MAG: hypothetical protein ABGZ23_27420 [Fuerstiella sp.]|nr:hypothetical protein [Fuerstiella sp.]
MICSVCVRARNDLPYAHHFHESQDYQVFAGLALTVAARNLCSGKAVGPESWIGDRDDFIGERTDLALIRRAKAFRATPRGGTH